MRRYNVANYKASRQELAALKGVVIRSSVKGKYGQVHTSLSVISRLRCLLAWAIMFFLAAATPSVEAETLAILHAFKGMPDGASPFAGLIQDSAGIFYGTTSDGGASNRMGTVFKMNNAGNFRVLHTFRGPDGGNPYGALVRDSAGNFYGTTVRGGSSNLGTVFKLGATGRHKVLHHFSGADGAYPYAGLLLDGAGNFYGTTSGGGAAGFGTVFKIDSAGNHEVLYSFAGGYDGLDGASPYAALLRDTAGNLYGTTVVGGAHGWGTIYKLGAAGDYKVLYSFAGSGLGPDGGYPFAALISDAVGNLYGTARDGGANGWGVLFKLSASGDYQILFDFSEQDGGSPYARLIRDSGGNLYGANCGGGANGADSWGTIFKLDATGHYSVLHTFTFFEGICPDGDLIRDLNGNFYGTTNAGGVGLRGSVFRLTP